MFRAPTQGLGAFAQGRKAFWESPTRGVCPVDGEEGVILFSRLGQVAVCAMHYREAAAAARPKREYPCDRCGHEGSFRDPAHRRDEYLCQDCHAEDGYIPGERAMISRVMKREGVAHSQGTKETCTAAGHGTTCKGQVKPRGGKLGVLCDLHANPRKWKDLS